MTRVDAHDFLELAGRLQVKPAIRTFPLSRVNDGLRAVSGDTLDGSAVTMSDPDKEHTPC